jgi:very-short-patch-repair endonuclease
MTDRGPVRYPTPPAVLSLAREQAGVATRRQLLAAGLSYRSQRLRIAAGQWTDLFGCLVIIPGPEALQRATAVALRLGKDAIVTGPLALDMHGLAEIIPERVALQPMAVVPSRRHDSQRDLRIIRDTVERTCERRAHVMIASPHDAIADCAMYLGMSPAQELVDRALMRGAIGIEHLRRLTAARVMVGRNGSVQLRSILRAAEGGARFEAERRLRRILPRVAGGAWRHNVAIMVGAQQFVLDVADETLRVCIEVDGRAYHSDTQAFESDRIRQNALVVAGWLVLRFTWAEITGNPTAVVAAIQAAVESRGRKHA